MVSHPNSGGDGSARSRQLQNVNDFRRNSLTRAASREKKGRLTLGRPESRGLSCLLGAGLGLSQFRHETYSKLPKGVLYGGLYGGLL